MPLLSLLLLLACLRFGHPAGEEEEEPFAVHDMLRSAVGLNEREAVSQDCVPGAVADAWKSGFQAAVDTMMQKTKRTMQLGLASMAQGVLALVDGSKGCGELFAFKRLREQAERLKVLASTRSLAGLDAKVQYEPLKALTVGGVDVHLELNALLVAWQMKRGPGEVGVALAKFFTDFAEDQDQDVAPPPGAPADTSQEEAPPPVTHQPGAVQRTPTFWAAALNQAFAKLQDSSQPVVEACLSVEQVMQHAGKLDEAFARMMQKTQRSMQKGLRMLAANTASLLEALEQDKTCQYAMRKSTGSRRLLSAASRLGTLVGTRSLINPGTNVQYQALEGLKVAGVDVHLELNRLIGSWINDKSSKEVGDSLADFFEDFREQEEELEDTDGTAVVSTHPLATMLSDAVAAAGAATGDIIGFDPACFSNESPTTFGSEVEAAIEHMLKKRRKTMQQGLKELADAVDKFFGTAPAECTLGSGAQVIMTGAKKLKRLTRRTIVDYGTYIKYEALKSLEVGGVTVHSELNGFLTAWKLRGRGEAGAPLGILFKRLSTISGHDEF